MERRLLLLCATLAAAVVVFAVSPQEPHETICSYRKICRCDSGLTCICNAKTKEITLLHEGPGYLPKTIGSINIHNCQQVKIFSRSIYGIQPLIKVNLSNIPNLYLEREAFFWDTTKIQESYPEPGINIIITNSTIMEIQSEAFKGHINSIYFNNVNITTVAPLAFANTATMDRIDILNCYIQRFSPKSFNKLILDSFTIEGGYIGTIPSNTMNSVEILSNLRFEGVYFNTIRSSAFRITKPKSFKLRACKIMFLEGEAFKITTNGDIFIDDNIIDNINEGAFQGIQQGMDTARDGTQKTLVLENNTLTRFEDGALSLNSSRLKIIIDQIIINQECDCNQIKRWSTKVVRYPQQQKSLSKFIWCHRTKKNTLVSEFEIKHCSAHPSKIPLILTVIIGTLVVLICLCSIGFWLYNKHVKQYMNVPTIENNRKYNGNHMIVVPERVYKESEIYVMAESVQPIKEESPPKVISKPTQ